MMNKLRPIPRVVADETTLEKLQRYYSEGQGMVQLLPKESELHERLIESYKLLIEHKIKSKAVDMIKEIFNVDRSTAYRYLNDAEILFCKTNKLEKETLREIINDMLYTAYNLAKKKKDDQSIAKIALALIKNNSTDKDNSELPWKDWKPNLYYMMIHSNGKPISINLDHSHKLPNEEIQSLLESFEDVIEPDFEILDSE